MKSKEQKAAARKEWNIANKDKVSAHNKKYYEANKEKRLAANKEWREANKEKLAAAKKEWAAANKDKRNAIYKRYYLKLNLANAKVSRRTLDAWAAQVKERTQFCEWCYSEDSLEAHHILPKSKYPQFALDINNGRTMCQNCHMNCHIQGGY